jgi:beta-ribofuranosylaminobenzene 5'-phosphate synthase
MAEEDTMSITVTAPARLHMGFLDMNGELGRRFGGLGLTLSDICTRLAVSKSTSISASGPSNQRTSLYAQTLFRALGLTGGVHIEVLEAIPEHVGLGSGTQLALAVSSAIARLYELDMELRVLAGLMQRGIRSGVGLGAFEQGGFIVDGGQGDRTTVPPVICRTPFPEGWRIMLIFDWAYQGLNGALEVAAFKRLEPIESTLAMHLCRVLLMQVLPALVEEDFNRFSGGITVIQDIVGDYFSGSQGGRYSSPKVAEVLGWLKAEGVQGIGQSSWGPTGFALFENAERAEHIVIEARSRWGEPLSFMVCTGRNKGAEILLKSAELSSHSLNAYPA